jgi:hypothetical protein
MNYYSDDYPETPLEEFLAVYERLTSERYTTWRRVWSRVAT